MDNVTHTLAGAAFAELVVRARQWRRPDEAPTPTLRGALWLSSMLASNAPDVDVVLTPALRAPLGYLLHHRGHTHTVLVAPLLAALSVGLAWLWARRRGALRRPELALAMGLATAMTWLHVAMDYGNSYGVHPFWPFSSRWHYGDAIFILEPLLWAVLAIPLALTVTTRAARYVLGGIAVLGLALSATVPYVTYVGLALVVVVSALASLIARNVGPLARALVAVLGLVIVEGGFFVAHGQADVHARGAMAAAFPRATTLDVVLMPSPGNPLCWSALGIAIERDDLVMRRFGLSLAGAAQPVDACRFYTPSETTAVHTPIERTSTESIAFFDEVRTPLTLLRDVAEHDQDAAAFFRFARAPYVLTQGEATIAGDVRFDRERDLGFGELELHRDAPLEGWVPAWEPPRLDAIDPAHTPPPRVHDIVTE